MGGFAVTTRNGRIIWGGNRGNTGGQFPFFFREKRKRRISPGKPCGGGKKKKRDEGFLLYSNS